MIKFKFKYKKNYLISAKRIFLLIRFTKYCIILNNAFKKKINFSNWNKVFLQQTYQYGLRLSCILLAIFDFSLKLRLVDVLIACSASRFFQTEMIPLSPPVNITPFYRLKKFEISMNQTNLKGFSKLTFESYKLVRIIC
jgi:hypothetical protein